MVVSLYRWRRWLGAIVVTLVLGLLAPHWVMAGAPCDALPSPLSHVETSPTDGNSTAALHHHLDHEHSHDTGALLAPRGELGQFVPSVPQHNAEALLRLPIAFVIDRPPRV